MDGRSGLTRVELLVVAGVVSIVVLLVLVVQIEMSARDSRRFSRLNLTIRCMSKLKQWGIVFKLYADDHDGSFISGEGGDSEKPWFEPFHAAYGDADIWFCPTASRPHVEGGRNHFGAWTVGEVSGSYGLNGWVCNPRKGNVELRGRGPIQNYWGTPLNVQGSGNVPMLAEALWFEGRPRHTDTPPELPGNTDANMSIVYDPSQMGRFCIDRHEGHVNVLFVDFSVRKVGLKELWTLKWHRNYDSSGPWTSAGDVSPTDWPPWMRNFKDY